MGNCIGGCSAAKRVPGSFVHARKSRCPSHYTDIDPTRGRLVSHSRKYVSLQTSLQACAALLCPKYASQVASLLTLDSAALTCQAR